MNVLKSIFSRKEEAINSYTDFWKWFVKNEKRFYKVVKNSGDIHKNFFDKLAPKLDEIKDGFWFMTGMYNDDTAELVLTADGVIKNIVFVEELVACAPKLHRWKITALKQPVDANAYGIEMDGIKFNETTMNFYSHDHEYMPDEIDITITHSDFSEENRSTINNGVLLALDNSLGELKTLTTIDYVDVEHPKDAKSDLIPIRKLKDFLIWREKEFVEKYDGIRYDATNDNYSLLEATLKNGLPLVAMINSDLLKWDRKASHPWIAVMEITYNGAENKGMPDKSKRPRLDKIEDEMLSQLPSFEGYLNIGRQTADSKRKIYFACVEFRKSSKRLYAIKEKYKHEIELDYYFYKDKYWQSFERFQTKDSLF